MKPRELILPLVCAFVALAATARGDDASEAAASPADSGAELPPVGIGGLSVPEHYQVESLRGPAEMIRAPHAVSVVSRDEIRRARPALDLAEALELVPGVYAQSSRNFAQDTRVSIRGFGSRARFGIRGVRVLVDGIPTTLADGQSEVDSIDNAFVERIEVVRGPISSLYGGGGGGIISAYTLEPTEDPTVSGRTLFGSDGLSRYEATARDTLGGTGVVLGFARSRMSGYRDHSRGEQNTYLAKLSRRLPNSGKLGFQFSAVHAPEGQDPGGLTLAQVRANRKQARPGFFGAQVRDAGEDLDQYKYALTWDQPVASGQSVHASVYQIFRDFSNKLPFETSAQVDFDRSVTGGSLVYNQQWHELRWMLGFDGQFQRDDRQRYDNLPGGLRGPLRLDQRERVTSLGPFLQAELQLTPELLLIGGARYDWLKFEVDDRFLGNGDQSDDKHFRQLSPRVGFSYAFQPDPGRLRQHLHGVRGADDHRAAAAQSDRRLRPRHRSRGESGLRAGHQGSGLPAPVLRRGAVPDRGRRPRWCHSRTIPGRSSRTRAKCAGAASRSALRRRCRWDSAFAAATPTRTSSIGTSRSGPSWTPMATVSTT